MENQLISIPNYNEMPFAEKIVVWKQILSEGSNDGSEWEEYCALFNDAEGELLDELEDSL